MTEAKRETKCNGKNRKMNKLIISLMLCMVLLSFTSAWTSSEFVLDSEKILEKIDTTTKFGTYKIVESSWYDPLQIWTKKTIKEIDLKENTDYCGGDIGCLSSGTIVLNKDGTLIDDLIWKRSFDDGKTFVDWNGYTNWKILVEEDVNVYETKCIDLKPIYDEKNDTYYTPQECSQVLIGTEKQYKPLDFKKEYKAGAYNYKIEGNKKPNVIYDWIIKTNGELLTNWAVWGAVIGVGGVEANITINSPANNSIQYTNLVTTNATANVTGGAYLTNASLNLSVNGGAWEIRNTTDLGISGDGLVSYYTLDETSGTTAYDSLGRNNGTNNGTTINQIGKINKSYSFDGINDYIDLGTQNYYPKITISTWIYTDWSGSSWSSIIAKGYNQDWDLRRYSNENKITFSLPGNTVDLITGVLSSNQWIHIVATYDGTNAKIYVNGEEKASKSYSTDLTATNTQVYIGRNNEVGGNTKWWKGKIDEVGIWNRSLTQAEITALYNSGAGSRPTTTTTTTTTFTNTFNAGDVVDFNYEFCDSDGDCGQSETRRFTIDGTAPSIALNYPTALIDYGKVNGTLQLNFTATDTNLDSVWYNYNGTNVTIAGAVSGVYNVSNITLTTDKEVEICANDTAGNEYCEVFGWDYKVFENSRSFTTPIVETSLDTFVINVTSGLSLSSVYLNYNGTEYSTSLSGGVYTKQLPIPAVTQDSTMQVYWRFVYDGTNITSEITNQTVSKLIFNICNATINNTLINFTTKSATNPFPIVNSTFKSSWMLSASVGATPTNFTYEDIDGNKSSYAFCTNTNTTTIYTDAEVEYDGAGYALNFYYLDNMNLTATSPQNISLYLLNDSLAAVTILKVVSASQQPQAEHQINIQSYDVGTGTFYLVGMAKTNFNGEDVAYLNWYDTLYKFIVLDENGNVVKTTGTTKISSSPTTIELENEITFPYDKFEDFVYSLYYENSTSNFVLTYTKPSGEVDKACLRVYKHSAGNDSLICNSCETSASATLFCNVASYGNGTYVALFYATGSFSLVDWIYEYVGGTFQTTIYNLLGNGDASFYAFLFAGLITVALFINAVFGIIALMIGLIGASALGFTALQWGQMTGVIFIGGFIIWLLKR